MGTKTIGLREEVYERLKPRKREGFGTLPDSAAEALEDAASASR
ncbi:antitoxin VapB family protein [Natronomonas sp. LN261]|nr:antitoxin VapB family protein [Natronomonas sp. LN261]